MNILLHQCCGPCSIYPLKKMLEENHNIICYFFNHNIHPMQEFYKRLESSMQVARHFNVKAVADDYYGLKEFLRMNVYKENSRCYSCYKRRIVKTAQMAKKMNCDAFSLSLLYSKMQNHEMIKKIGEETAQKYNIKFYYKDYRDGWQEGKNDAVNMEIYRQNYCGCIYSEEDRFIGQLPKKYRKKYKEINYESL